MHEIGMIDDLQDYGYCTHTVGTCEWIIDCQMKTQLPARLIF